MSPRREPLNRRRIYEAALQLIAEDGVAHFSMRKLAKRLGVEAMALYKHVANKAALLDGIEVLLLEQIVVPTEGHWAARMRAMAHSYRRLALTYPRLFPFLVSRPQPAEAAPVLEQMWTVLGDAGLAEDRRLVALRTLSSYVLGFSLSEVVGEATASGGTVTGPAWSPSPRESDMLFDQGLDAILAGVADLETTHRALAEGQRGAGNLSFDEHSAES